jgi:hypothetical protein
MLVVGLMVGGFSIANDLHDGGILRGESHGFLCSGWWFGYRKVFPLLVRTLLELLKGHRLSACISASLHVAFASCLASWASFLLAAT